MNYQKIYDSLVRRRQMNPSGGYSESHHIVPRCMGGLDNKENLVRLAAKEHYIAHRLLCKIYPKESGLWFALGMMSWCHSTNHNRYIPSRIYDIVRKEFSKGISDRQSGINNSNFGTRWISNVSSQSSTKIHKTDPLPEGYIEGRVMDWESTHHTRKCRVCGKTGCKSTMSVFCSTECKRKNVSSYLDNKEEEFIIAYKQTRSLNKTLKMFGGRNAGGYISKATELILNSGDEEAISIYNKNRKK